MLLITENEISQLITMKMAIQKCKDALLLAASGKTQIPLRMSMPISENEQFLFKPGYIQELNTAGVKIVSVFPQNTHQATVQAQMLLMDARNGEIQAIIDGTYLTRLRTGALQGAATDILARANAKTALLIGTGGQALCQLEALLNVRNLSTVWVCGRNYETTKQFVDKLAFYDFNTKIIPIKHIDEVITEADIITAITTSNTPVFDGSLVKNGTHINGMGSYTPQMQELPEDVVIKADKIFFDTKEGVLAGAGDFIIPIQKGLINPTSNHCNEIGDLLRNKVPGRETESEITLFKSVGTAVLDIVTAEYIFRQAVLNKIGTNVKF